MRKSLIIIAFILIEGCTAKRIISESPFDNTSLSTEKVIDAVWKNNISEENFFIEKASLSIKAENETKNFLFNVKFKKPDKFLFSIRNNAGIEGARIYLTNDTVLINDRIENRILYGRPKDLEKIAGIPYFIIKVAFGDLLEKEYIKKEKINNQLFLMQQYKGNIWKSYLDYKTGKVKLAVISNEYNKEEIVIKYSKFGKEDKHIPKLIELKDFTRNINAKIRLIKVQIRWNGELEFIPGKGYRKEEIK